MTLATPYAPVEDLTDYQIGWLLVYFTNAPAGTITLKLKIQDSNDNPVEVEKTIDVSGVEWTQAAWHEVAFDLSGDGTINYADIEDVIMSVQNDSGAELNGVLLDGLRFTPHFFTFKYQFSAATDARLIEIKGVTTKEYFFEKSTDDSAWNSIQENDSFTADYALWFNDTAESDIYFRVRMHVVNQDNEFSIDIGDILILDYLDRGAFDTEPKFKPVLSNAITQLLNWVNAQHVFKTSEFFGCDINIPLFSAMESGEGQNDADFTDVMFKRIKPFYIWLNGDRGTNFNIRERAWDENNLFLVQHISENPQAHFNSLADAQNAGEERTITLIESAWIEAD